MKILIIEDEHKIAAAIKKGLEQENFAVDTSYNGTDGYDLASSEDYDLIVLDLMLPGMDGMEICKKLRQENNHTPIIMLTARGDLDDKVKGLNNGADDYLAKPFSFEELLARIRALIRRPHNVQNSTLSCGDLVIDTVGILVKRKNKEINLTKKEFALLEYLLRNKNKTVTKDQILNHVWSYDADVLPNTVEQYIRYLRAKIDEPFKNDAEYIHTVRGFGYQIKEPN